MKLNEQEMKAKIWKVFWRRKFIEVIILLALILGPFYIGLAVPVCGPEFKGTKMPSNCQGLSSIECNCSAEGFYMSNYALGLAILGSIALVGFILYQLVKWNWRKAREEVLGEEE